MKVESKPSGEKKILERKNEFKSTYKDGTTNLKSWLYWLAFLFILISGASHKTALVVIDCKLSNMFIKSRFNM